MGRGAAAKDSFSDVLGVKRGLSKALVEGTKSKERRLADLAKALLKIPSIECGFEGTREQVTFQDFIDVIVDDEEYALEIAETMLQQTEPYRFYHDDDVSENFVIVDKHALEAQVRIHKALFS